MYCPKCGAQNTESSLFCSKCGARFLNDSFTQNANIGTWNQKRKNLIIPIIIISAVIVAGAIIFFFILRFSSSLSSTAGPKTVILYQANDSGIADR